LNAAVESGAQALLCHHPLLLQPLKNLTPADETGRLVLQAVQQGIAVLAAHTNLDSARDGLNDWLARLLNLQAAVPLAPPDGQLLKLVVFVPAGYEERARQLPAAERDLARLTRSAKVNADIYTFLLQKHEEARLARAATISNINVIDPAIKPDRPVKPQKAKNLLLGLVVGVMAGLGLAFFFDYLDDSLKDGEAAQRLLGLPLLSVIPFIGLEDSKEERGRERFVERAKRRVLIAQFKPKSAAAEAFRSLRTALHFSALGREKKVLLVTSAFPGEGKTTLSGNLAVTLAQAGERVLLVGCDLRKPTLEDMFGGTRSDGLTEVLVGDVKVEDVIRHTGLFRLDFLPAGTTPPNPAELLGSDRMHSLIDELRDRYDIILLDAPPVLAVTDATVLTSVADQVVWMLEVGAVSQKAARRVKEILSNVSAPLVGLVMATFIGFALA